MKITLILSAIILFSTSAFAQTTHWQTPIEEVAPGAFLTVSNLRLNSEHVSIQLKEGAAPLQENQEIKIASIQVEKMSSVAIHKGIFFTHRKSSMGTKITLIIESHDPSIERVVVYGEDPQTISDLDDLLTEGGLSFSP